MPRKVAKKAAKRTRPATKASRATGKRASPPAGMSPITPSKEIDMRLREMGDWRGQALSRLRDLIKQADPGVVEDVKWRKASNAMAGVPVWSHDGMICTGETYKDYVKLTFAYGAMLADPAKLFNAGFGGGTRRAIDVRKGEDVDPAAFKALVQEAVEHNQAKE